MTKCNPCEDRQNQFGFSEGVSNKQRNSPTGFRQHLLPAKVTEAFDVYWRFAAERQAIFFRRITQEPPPWTDDPILAEFKFTNAYRASDRVSQYLIKEVIYKGPSTREETFFRIILFKLFNRIDTWELLRGELGELSYANYDFDRYDKVLTQAMADNIRIYSAAYIMPSGGGEYSRKHRAHLKLLEAMLNDQVPSRLARMRSMQQGFELLLSYPMIGNFLAYQLITDINYSEITDFSEKEFVMPGPGAIDGISKCFSDYGGLNEIDIIHLMMDRQEQEFERLGINFQSLWGRRLQLIDCQNLFCEVSKYTRASHPNIRGVSGRQRIKQRFQPLTKQIQYWFPPKWGLNPTIEAWWGRHVTHS